MDHELEAERRCMRAELFMRQATDNTTGETNQQNQGDLQQQQPTTTSPSTSTTSCKSSNPANI